MGIKSEVLAYLLPVANDYRRLMYSPKRYQDHGVALSHSGEYGKSSKGVRL